MSRRKISIIPILYVLLPLVALAATGVASFLWHRAHPRNEAEQRTERIREHEKTRDIRPADPEEFSAGLEEQLRSFLAEYGVEEKGFKRAKPDTSLTGVRNVYKASIPSSSSLTLLHLKIRDMIRESGGETLDAVESADGRTLTLTLGARSRKTDVLALMKTPGLEMKRVVAAVILDDLGIRDPESARRLCMLGQTVTLSILPFQRHTGKVVELAVETGTPYMLHMPMEPKSSSENPGEGAILAGDSDEIIERKLAQAFGSVSDAPGLNNHMGSRATEDPRVMATVMRYLQKDARFFVDSRTSNQSVAFSVSQQVKVRCAVMSGYLDVIEEREAIRRRLHELARIAFEEGRVIMIGHDRPLTVEVLEQELPKLAAEGIRFVGVEELVK